MDSLQSLIDNKRTDKNTLHSYLELYEILFNCKKKSVKNVLEIGIDKGGSIKLWHDYFLDAKVIGVDIIKDFQVWDELKNKERIKLFTSTDAYNIDFIKNNLPEELDVIIDDGPHTLESMKFFLKHYSPLLSNQGILVLEDIQSWKWIKCLKESVPEELKRCVFVYDLRANKGRYDDIVLVINKNWF